MRPLLAQTGNSYRRARRKRRRSRLSIRVLQGPKFFRPAPLTPPRILDDRTVPWVAQLTRGVHAVRAF